MSHFEKDLIESMGQALAYARGETVGARVTVVEVPDVLAIPEPPARSDPEEREAQFQAFVEASRELKCDEDPEAFKGIVRKVVSAPKPSPAGPTSDDA